MGSNDDLVQEGFDSQAAHFDERTGVPAAACCAVAEAVAGIAGQGAALLEIGAGTGAIGCEICKLMPGYRALDSSPRMIEVFAGRLGGEASAHLVVGDAQQRWPVDDQSLGVVFGSRALHLLDTNHVVDELDRVLAPGGVLLVGRIERGRDDPRELMRREMRRRLSALAGSAAPRSRRGLVPVLLERGAEPLARRAVARWTDRWTPREVLEAWRQRQPLSGVVLQPAARASLLSALERWVGENLEGLDVPFESEPTYTLEGARVSGNR